MHFWGSRIINNEHGIIIFYDKIIILNINGSFLDFLILFTQLKKQNKNRK